MNFDPLTYALARVDRNEERIRLSEQSVAHQADMLEEHSARLDRLEAWKRKLDALLRKWPYLVAPAAVIAVNSTPKQIADIIVAIIKAAP